MKLSREHLIVARQFGIREEHLIKEIMRAFDRHPIATLIQMEEAEPRMVAALRHCTYHKEMQCKFV